MCWISYMNWVNRWLSLKWIMILNRTMSKAKVSMSCKRRSTRRISEDPDRWTKAAMMHWRWKAIVRNLRGNWHHWCNQERCWILINNSVNWCKLIQMKLISWRKSWRMEGRYRVIAIRSYCVHRVHSRTMIKSITPSRMPPPLET